MQTSSPKCADQFWSPTRIVFNGYWSSFLGINWLECEDNHSPASSAKVNEWICTSAVHIRGQSIRKLNLFVSSTNQKVCWDAQITDSFIFHVSAPIQFSGIFHYPQMKLHCFLHNRFFNVIVCALFCFFILFDCKSYLLLSPVFQLSIFSLLCSLIACESLRRIRD